jgi:hypothetical protein
MPIERPPLVGEVNAKFADKGCHMVSVTDPYACILGFVKYFKQVEEFLFSIITLESFAKISENMG